MTKSYTEYIVTDAILLDKQSSFTSKKCKFIFKMKLYNAKSNSYTEGGYTTVEDYDLMSDSSASEFLTGRTILVEDCVKPQIRKKFKLKTQEEFKMKLEDHVNEMGKVTKESEKIIANTLKSIETRITESDNAVKSLKKEAGIDVKGKSADEVFTELKSIWHTLDRDTKIELSKNIAGRFQMSRFMLTMEVTDND